MTRFAVDLDGTLAQTVEATLEKYNEKWRGAHYTKEDIIRWDYWNIFEEIDHLPEPARRDFILRIMDDVWNEGLVRADPDAAFFMRQLSEHGQVDVVTGRGKGTPDEVIEAWLRASGIPYDRLVRVRGSKAKQFYGYDVFYDDDPTLALDIAQKWPEKSVVLRDQAWNRFVPDSERVRRVHSLAAAVPESSVRQQRLFRHPRPLRSAKVAVRRHLRHPPGMCLCHRSKTVNRVRRKIVRRLR